jgi:hypothetical protein
VLFRSVGHYELKSFLEGGNQFWNVSNGHAAGKPYLQLGWDVKRFTFLYDSSEALALTMQATASESGISLNWVQDDYDTFAGYNIYRSTTENGNYTKLNPYLLPYDQNSYEDYDVLPGQIYYYYFTVSLTSFDQNGNLIESDPSGKVSVRAYDTLKPTIVHTNIYDLASFLRFSRDGRLTCHQHVIYGQRLDVDPMRLIPLCQFL